MKINNGRQNETRYMQIYRHIKKDIVDGIYPYGSKIPSKRVISSQFGVSVITAEHAYDLLCDEGYIRSVQKSGYFVDFRPDSGFSAFPEEITIPTTTPREYYDSFEDYRFPSSVLSKTMRSVITNRENDILLKSPNNGIEEFRKAIAGYLARNKDIRVSPDRIIVGSGAEYLYNLIAILIGKGETVALEDPSYDKIRRVYEVSNIRCDLLPLGNDGIESNALNKTNARVLHISPFRSFPTGITSSASKRHEYIRWADKRSGLIIEDDYESEFSVLGKPVETLFSMAMNDNVIYLNTFSKSISPALRVGYMVLPEHLITKFNEQLGFYSCTVPTFEQLVLSELLSSGAFERHINRVRRKMRSGL